MKDGRRIGERTMGENKVTTEVIWRKYKGAEGRKGRQRREGRGGKIS